MRKNNRFLGVLSFFKQVLIYLNLRQSTLDVLHCLDISKAWIGKHTEKLRISVGSGDAPLFIFYGHLV